jgi:hypothetical protein
MLIYLKKTSFNKLFSGVNNLFRFGMLKRNFVLLYSSSLNLIFLIFDSLFNLIINPSYIYGIFLTLSHLI